MEIFRPPYFTLNPSHPLSKGLLFSIPPGFNSGTSLIEPVRGVQVGGGTHYKILWEKSGIKGLSAGIYVKPMDQYSDYPHLKFNNTSKFTIFMVYERPAVAICYPFRFSVVSGRTIYWADVNNNVQARIWGPSATLDAGGSGVAPPINTPTAIAMTYDSSASHSLKAYINGSLIGSSSGTDPGDFTAADSDYIKFSTTNEGYITYAFHVYDYPLSQNLISSLSHSPFKMFRTRLPVSRFYVPAGGGAISAEATDGFIASETLAKIATLRGSAVDGFSGGDSGSKLAQLISASVDGAVFSELLFRTANYSAELSDQTTVSDSASVMIELNGISTDGFSLSEALIIGNKIIASSADGIEFSDLPLSIGTFYKSISDEFIGSDASQINATFIIQTADGFQFADTAAVLMKFAAIASDVFKMSDIAFHLTATGALTVTFAAKKSTITFVVKK